MSKETREITEHEQEIFIYLNELRESGNVNMFGAGEFIEIHFGLDKIPARDMLILWTLNYQESGEYQTINI